VIVIMARDKTTTQTTGVTYPHRAANQSKLTDVGEVTSSRPYNWVKSTALTLQGFPDRAALLNYAADLV